LLPHCVTCVLFILVKYYSNCYILKLNVMEIVFQAVKHFHNCKCFKWNSKFSQTVCVSCLFYSTVNYLHGRHTMHCLLYETCASSLLRTLLKRLFLSSLKPSHPMVCYMWRRVYKCSASMDLWRYISTFRIIMFFFVCMHCTASLLSTICDIIKSSFEDFH